MYILLVLQILTTTPPLASWSNLGYFQDQGMCRVTAEIVQKSNAVVTVVCVPLKTPEEKKL